MVWCWSLTCRRRRQYPPHVPGATTAFLLPPSVEEPAFACAAAAPRPRKSIQERLATARQELAEQDKFTVKLVNNQIQPCAAELYQVICQRAGCRSANLSVEELDECPKR